MQVPVIVSAINCIFLHAVRCVYALYDLHCTEHKTFTMQLVIWSNLYPLYEVLGTHYYDLLYTHYVTYSLPIIWPTLYPLYDLLFTNYMTYSSTNYKSLRYTMINLKVQQKVLAKLGHQFHLATEEWQIINHQNIQQNICRKQQSATYGDCWLITLGARQIPHTCTRENLYCRIW